MAADHEGGPGGETAMPRCSAFCAHVTSALESYLRRTGRECGRI